MAELYFRKMAGGTLIPDTEQDAEKMAAVKNGSLVIAKIKQPRNARFHRLFFAMLNFIYGYWEPPDKIGEVAAEKNFDRFRKDMLILAGYRTTVVNIKGEVRYEAKSIAFGSLDEIRFHEVYKAVFAVGWRLVLSQVQGMTEAEAENAIQAMASFGG